MKTLPLSSWRALLGWGLFIGLHLSSSAFAARCSDWNLDRVSDESLKKTSIPSELSRARSMMVEQVFQSYRTLSTEHLMKLIDFAIQVGRSHIEAEGSQKPLSPDQSPPIGFLRSPHQKANVEALRLEYAKHKAQPKLGWTIIERELFAQDLRKKYLEKNKAPGGKASWLQVFQIEMETWRRTLQAQAESSSYNQEPDWMGLENFLNLRTQELKRALLSEEALHGSFIRDLMIMERLSPSLQKNLRSLWNSALPKPATGSLGSAPYLMAEGLKIMQVPGVPSFVVLKALTQDQPWIELHHGDSSLRSHPTAMVTTQNLIASMGYSSFNVDSSIWGDFPRTTKPEMLSDLLRKRTLELKKMLPQIKSPEAALPYELEGRSMGGARGLIQYAVSQQLGREHGLDLVVTHSLANPMTLEKQLQNLEHQMSLGGLTSLDPQVLDHAFRLGSEFLSWMQNLKSSNLWKVQGEIVLMLEGDANVDGGREVLEDARRFRDEFLPAAKIYRFQNPILARVREVFGEFSQEMDLMRSVIARNEEDFLASHLILSSKKEVSIERILDQMRRSGFSESQLHQLQLNDYHSSFLSLQAKEKDLVHWGMRDHVLEMLHHPNPQVKHSARIYRDYLERLRSKTRQPEMSFFDYGLRLHGLSVEEVKAAPKNLESSLASRAQRVRDFWAREKYRENPPGGAPH